jgi:hypothetical protein
MTGLSISTTAIAAMTLALLYMPDSIRPSLASPVFLAAYGAVLIALGALLRRGRETQPR